MLRFSIVWIYVSIVLDCFFLEIAGLYISQLWEQQRNSDSKVHDNIFPEDNIMNNKLN